MGDARIGRWGIKSGLIRLAGAGGFGQGVVDFEDGVFGAIGAVLVDVLAADDGEGVEDVGSVVAVEAVEVEEGGVEFRAEQFSLAVPSGDAVLRGPTSRNGMKPGPVDSWR